MRRTRLQSSRLIAILLWVAVGYVSIFLWLPSWASQRLQAVTGNSLTIGHAHVNSGLQIVLSDVSLNASNPGVLLRAQQVSLSPRWLSWRHKTLWVKTLEITNPHLQIRRTPSGELVGFQAFSELPEAFSPSASSASETSWHMVVQTVHVVGGTVEFVDHNLPHPFYGTLSHWSLVGGPLEIPWSGRIPLAMQGQLVGHHRYASAAYCSGWFNPAADNLELACQVEPVRLAAFEPYYQGPDQVRVYDATLGATGQFTAVANALTGRIQLTIANLSDSDLSFLRVRPDQLGESPALSGELQITGPLDQPSKWHFTLVPGNEIVQRLVRPLLNRGIDQIELKVGEQTIPVTLTPVTQEGMSDIESTSKTVQETLEIIAPTSLTPEPSQATPETPSPASEPQPSMGSPEPTTPADGQTTSPPASDSSDISAPEQEPPDATQPPR